MAIIYGKNTAVDYAAGNIASFGKSYSRMGAAPLDKYEVWYDYAELVKYASYRGDDKDGNPVYNGNTEVTNTSAVTSYVGQKVAYVNETEGKIYHYSIELDGTLKEIGADPLNVEALVKGDGGKIPKAFWIVDSEAVGEESAEDYQPEVGHIEIHWVTPEAFEDTNTVTTVAAADKSVNVTADKNDTINKDYKVKVNISAAEGNDLVLKEDGLFVEVPEVVHPEYAVRKEEKDGYHGIYHLTKDDTDVDVAIEVPVTDLSAYAKTADLVDYTVTVATENVEDTNFKHYIFKQLGKDIAHIDIPKDLVVQSGKVEVYETAGAWGEAGTYIVLTIANQTNPIYVNAKDLVDVYTVADTATVDLTLTGTEIKADVKISEVQGNSLVAKADGLYVNAPTLPTAADVAVENQYVTAVDQKDGKVTITRKQINYNELAGLPTIPGTPDFGVLTLTGEQAIVVENKSETETQDKVVKLLIDDANKGNVTLTQSDAGLKAEIDLGDYAKTADLPELAIAANVDAILPAENKPVTGKVIAALTADDHTITPTVLEVVTKAGWDGIHTDNGLRLISQTEINKLAKLNLDNGEITISGSVNANQVKELYDTVVNIVKGSTTDLDPDTDGDQLGLGIEKGAQANKIESIGLPDAVLAIANKEVTIPAFVAGKYGVIKGAELVGDKAVANKVYANDGVGEVKAISTDILVQGADELILNGGNAALN